MDDRTATAETTDTASTTAEVTGSTLAGTDPQPVEDVLVEEVSIDGMCGVY